MVYKPRYLALNVAIAIAYFYFIKYLIAFQDKGVFIASIPVYMLVILSITSAITFTIAIYSINNTRRNQAKITASTTSVLSVVASAMIGGCGCQVSILAGLAGIVAGASGAFALNVVLAENSFYIISAIVAINILLAIYYVNKLSKPACLISKGGGNAEQRRNKKE
jgi:heme/copper-type cytochrome/quinol oxidase subunit 3